MKNSKKIILGTVIIGCIVAIYFIVKSDEPKPENKKITDKISKALSKITGKDESSLPTKGNPNRQIKFNTRGQEVEYLQAYLNQKHNTGLSSDGVFGEKTYAALTQNGYKFPITITELTTI